MMRRAVLSAALMPAPVACLMVLSTVPAAFAVMSMHANAMNA
jgi:hypothetical protein